MALYQQSFSVFSTYVEVILIVTLSDGETLCFLHVCGGDPKLTGGLDYVWKFSPRMWR